MHEIVNLLEGSAEALSGASMMLAQRDDISLVKRLVLCTWLSVVAYGMADLAEHLDGRDEEEPAVVYGGEWTDEEEDAMMKVAADA